MPRSTKRATSRRPKRFARRKAGRKSSGSQLVSKAMLYKAIARNLEVKMANIGFNYTSQSSTLTSLATNFYCPLPPVNLGIGSDQRIGDKIRPLKLVIRGYISLVGDVDSSSRALAGRLFCGLDKAILSKTDFSSLNINILDNGGTSTTYGGNLFGQCALKNTQMYRWYADKKFFLTKPTGIYQSAAIGGGVSSTPRAQDLFREFTITLTKKHLPAQFFYDSTENATFPVNFCPFIALGYCDPMTSGIAGNGFMGMTYTAVLHYTDA
ncbi:coat protein [Lake Sarah-associated circular virus-16]|uniref:coat protein n=1 Tax=Lake Sarah-associated circular virus-16 TaxID=1685742 RepID=UPI0007777219|nr:coat protein [Lake Sarah-associated circular virus-16]ALE29631.1 coat protein [Lake Sarah-associated circular virus-16]